MNDDKHNRLRINCWNQAIETFGTAHIFQKKAEKQRRCLKLLDFYALILPLFVGGTVLAFGPNVWGLPAILYIAGALGILQIVLFLWAIVMGWQDKHAYAVESAADNRRLSEQFKQIAETPPERNILESGYALLSQQHQTRMTRDEDHGMTDNERREGMRAGLRQFRRACDGCGQTPTSMKPTNCDVCGNF